MNKHKTTLQQFSYKAAYLVLTTYLLIQIITAIGFSQDGASKSGLTYRSNIPELDTRANIEIDPTTLGLNIIIPLVNLPGRGINMPINMRYSSKVWKIRHSFHWPDPPQPGQDPSQILLHADYAGGSAAGWITTIRTPRFSQGGGDSEPYIVRFEHTPPNPPTNRDTGFPDDGKPWDNSLPPFSSPTTLPLQYVKNNMLIQMPDQSVHELRVSDQLHNQLSNTYRGPAYAVDSSRMKFDIDTQILYLADGSRYDVFVPPDATVRYIDRNGNTLTYSNAFHGTTQVVDTLGRNIANPFANPYAPTRGDQQWVIPNAQGSNSTYIFRWRNLSEVLTDSTQPLRYPGRYYGAELSEVPGPILFEQSGYVEPYPASVFNFGHTPQLFNPVVLSEVELPNGQKYIFTYNVYGEIDKAVLPTGGYHRYRYGIVGAGSEDIVYAQGNRGVLEAWDSPTGNSADETPSWRYIPENDGVRATSPDGTVTKRYITLFGDTLPIGAKFGTKLGTALDGKIYDEKIYNSSGVMIRRSLYDWVFDGAFCPTPSTGRAYDPVCNMDASRNPQIRREVDILLDTSGNPLAKSIEYQYDNDQNVINTKFYDYVSISLSIAQSGTIGQIPNGALLRTLESTYLVNDPDIPQATRDAYRARHLIALSTKELVKDGSGLVRSATEYKYDEAAYPLTNYTAVTGWTDPQTAFRGNVTTVRRWLDDDQSWEGWTSGAWVETHSWYDQCGNVVKIRDANGNDTTIGYSDDFYGLSPQNTYAYPTSLTIAGPAHTTSTKYDFNTGLIREVTDPNNVKTKIRLHRSSQSIDTNGSGGRHECQKSDDDSVQRY